MSKIKHALQKYSGFEGFGIFGIDVSQIYNYVPREDITMTLHFGNPDWPAVFKRAKEVAPG